MSKVKLDRENDIDRMVYFKKDGFEYVLLEAGGKYDVLKKEEYHEDEALKKSFTWEENVEKFPNVWPLARKINSAQQKGGN